MNGVIMNNSIEHYVQSFSHMRRGATVYGPAPHKLILLLAVIEDIEAGIIKSNRIEPALDFIATFNEIWEEYVHSGHKCNFVLPFFHLSGEGFWHLHAFPGKEANLKKMSTVSSVGTLRSVVQYASLDPVLFAELKQPASRMLLKQTLTSCLIGDCPFCNRQDRDIYFENDLAFAFYDQYPVSPGHTLIVPKRHVASFFSLDRKEVSRLNDLCLCCKETLQVKFNPTGFNLGVNVGLDAGQSIFHCHVHLIPRYHGDVTNPLGGVRGVIPEKQHYRQGE